MRRSPGLAALLVAGAGLLAWLLAGWSIAVLDSDSMEPWASPGDLLVHVVESPAGIEPGEVVTVRLPDRGLVTHRVVAVDGDGDRRVAVLMGDASRFPDPGPVTLPDEVDRVALVVPGAGSVLRIAGPWLIGVLVLLVAGAVALGVARRDRTTPVTTPPAAPTTAPSATVDPRIEALLATCEQLEDDGVPGPVLGDLVRVRTAPVVGLPVAERSGAVLSLDDGGRFYVLAVADADRAMLDLVPVDSERRRAGTAALDLWWDAVCDGVPRHVSEAVDPWLRTT